MLAYNRLAYQKIPLRLSLRFGVGHRYLATKRTKYYNLKEEHCRMKF